MRLAEWTLGVRWGLCTELDANREMLAGVSGLRGAAWDDLLNQLPFCSEEFHAHAQAHICPDSQTRDTYMCS